MTTSSIHHRPTPWIAAAAAVTAIAAGSVFASLAHDGGHPTAPAEQSVVAVGQNPPRDFHYDATTSGGHVMLGQ